jgi:hypothetical protein
VSQQRVGGKYTTRGIEVTVTAKTDSQGTFVSFHSGDGCTKSGFPFFDEEATKEKVQARLNAERLVACAGCGRPFLLSPGYNLDTCKVCEAAAWEARRTRAAQEWKAARDAAWDARQKLWETATLAPIPWLVALRSEVLQRNPKRCPKWSFDLAVGLAVRDLVVQLQPKPTLTEWPRRHAQPLYLGVCVFDPGGVAKDVFRDGREKEDGRPGPARLKFELGDGGASGWVFRPTSWKARGGGGDQRGALLAIRCRLLEEMPLRLNQFAPDIMLSAHCLICGKALTDPASMARWIGPECASSGALTVPGLDRDAVARDLSAWLR